ncbi:hypothetical protein ACLOJK_023037 [Asimina triloba]
MGCCGRNHGRLHCGAIVAADGRDGRRRQGGRMLLDVGLWRADADGWMKETERADAAGHGRVAWSCLDWMVLCIEHDGGQRTLEPGLGVNGQKGRRSSDGRMTMGISFAGLDRVVEDEDGSIWGQGVGC